MYWLIDFNAFMYFIKIYVYLGKHTTHTHTYTHTLHSECAQLSGTFQLGEKYSYTLPFLSNSQYRELIMKNV